MVHGHPPLRAKRVFLCILFLVRARGLFFAETIHRRPLSESFVPASFYVALVSLVLVYLAWESFMSASLGSMSLVLLYFVRVSCVGVLCQGLLLVSHGLCFLMPGLFFVCSIFNKSSIW